MEPKKNRMSDLNRNRGLYFVLGLLFVMLLTLVALEWKTYDRGLDYDISMNVEDPLAEEVPLTIPYKTPPPPPVQAPPIIEIIDDEEERIESEIAATETDQEEKILEVGDVEALEMEEPEEVPFIMIEEVPVFPGCEKEKTAEDKRACFQKMMGRHIGKNFRYPEIAQELGIEGRVSVMFVIQKDGSIGNIRLRGPDKSLEAEARRIIEKLPRMTPGRQRNTAVRVPFSIPINFRLE
ncbi:energy transducer TonB [Pseudozobellia thermophila]|uniref:Protein TonB n=1 Tax=Pseudozobellia thermophila TaxID=192903 RepID=A0A1M6JFQ5_9FLAO|nr:energy transducer TonB [Pseudozobellia thermophila]SHJ45538.1 protein TonB [Pseudozobellia thermophila]